MFRLKDSIENWKQKLSLSNSFTNSDIEELESHLLEEIDTLKRKELTEEEAFFVATNRLGSVELLSSEFTKININSIYLKRVVWLLGGYLLISFIQQIINSISLISTNYIYSIDSFNIYKYPYLSLIISTIVSIIFLYFLFIPKYKLLSKIQNIFNYLFTIKKYFLILLFFVFIVVNSLGYTVLRIYIVRTMNISMGTYAYGKIMEGESMFLIIWPMLLCITFVMLSLNKSRNYKKAN